MVYTHAGFHAPPLDVACRVTLLRGIAQGPGRLQVLLPPRDKGKGLVVSAGRSGPLTLGRFHLWA